MIGCLLPACIHLCGVFVPSQGSLVFEGSNACTTPDNISLFAFAVASIVVSVLAAVKGRFGVGLRIVLSVTLVIMFAGILGQEIVSQIVI